MRCRTQMLRSANSSLDRILSTRDLPHPRFILRNAHLSLASVDCDPDHLARDIRAGWQLGRGP